MIDISMKKKITHQKTIYACYRLWIGDRAGKQVKLKIHVTLNYVYFQILLAAMPCFLQLQAMGNSTCIRNYT